MRAAPWGQGALPWLVLCGDLFGGGGLGRAGGGGFGGGAAGVLPAFAGVVLVEAKLGKVGADALGGLFGEGDPDPFADDFGELVFARHPTLEDGQDLFGRELAVEGALGVIDVGADGFRRVESFPRCRDFAVLRSVRLSRRRFAMAGQGVESFCVCGCRCLRGRRGLRVEC